jgi:CRP/FNR family cyclic AMP-dependent transcriptional regulator
MGEVGDIKLFASMGEENAKRFSPALVWRTYPANELVIDMDDPSTDVLFVVNGSVRVIQRAADGKQVILGELGPAACSGRWRPSTGSPDPRASPPCRHR